MTNRFYMVRQNLKLPGSNALQEPLALAQVPLYSVRLSFFLSNFPKLDFL
ncbi:MAG: hypothetical protein WDZ86_03535 [Gammaproteobacteria bacterium]